MQDILLFAGGVIGLLTFLMSVFEYRKQGHQKRIELYLEMSRRIEDNPDFRQVRTLLNVGSEDIRNIPKKTRSDYAGFLESVALMRNSGVISRQVACYMFSHDAVACWNSNAFWEDFTRDDTHWGLLRHFVEEMQSLRPQLQIKRIRL